MSQRIGRVIFGTLITIAVLLVVGKLSLRSTWEADDSLYVRAQEKLGIGEPGWIRWCMDEMKKQPGVRRDLLTVPRNQEEDVLRTSCGLALEYNKKGLDTNSPSYYTELEKRQAEWAMRNGR